MTFILYYGRIKSIYEKNVIVRAVTMAKITLLLKEGKGKYQMLDNLDSNLENSRIPAISSLDVNDDEVEIDLREIFYALKAKILLILMAALIGACVAAAYTQFLMTPIYSSTSSMLVLSKETTLTSLADLQLGASLTSDYTVLITSTPVLEQVIENLNLDMTTEQLKDTVTINNPTDTRILEITVDNADSTLAKDIVDEIANVSSSYIGDKMEVIPPKIIEVGKIATVRTSPSVKKNTALGFLLGFVACAAVVVIFAVMDDTIKTEEDIEKYLGVSVLAKVPDRKDYVNMKGKKNYKKKNKNHR